MNESSPKILIVDDELSIRKTLRGVFQDEGFLVIDAADGEKGLEEVAQESPDVVLLDIWMPGLDGIEALKRIKAQYENLPVIMMSGHASISTAVEATRLGAIDFIEKPLDLDLTVSTVKKALQSLVMQREAVSKNNSADLLNLDHTFSIKDLDLKVDYFNKDAFRGNPYPQKTLAASSLLYGQGLHSGKKSGLRLEPLPENSGIHFVDVALKASVPAHLNYVQSTGYATTVKSGSTQVSTIEHLMSAITAAGITNLLIQCNGEVPVMDGSAIEFCSLIKDIGLKEQNGVLYEIAIPKTIEVKSAKESIKIEPADGFTITYRLSYPKPIGDQEYTFTLNGFDDYEREISKSRTFGFVKDIDYLQRNGLALGGRFDNFVLVGEEGPINTSFRYANECVRHKILDAIGDLALLGRRLSGKITASMTGHSDNIDLLKKIADLME